MTIICILLHHIIRMVCYEIPDLQILAPNEPKICVEVFMLRNIDASDEALVEGPRYKCLFPYPYLEVYHLTIFEYRQKIHSLNAGKARIGQHQ